ncbi:MAG: glycosyltransferase [Chloroflexi bacterium]|nr:glycosyltransferase [Chloroflexota bacterium]
MSNTRQTVFIFPFGHVLSHVARCLMIARGLREIGCRVLFGGDGRYLELPRQEGFDIRPSVEIDYGIFLTAARKPLAGVGAFTAELAGRMVEDELRLYREVKPDLVLYDLHVSAATSAQVAGIPHAAVVNAYLTRYSATEWVSFPPLLRLALEPLRRRLNVGPANRMRRRYGLPPIPTWEALYHSDLVLMPDIPELAPTRNLPGHIHYTGPLIWEPDGALPDALERPRPGRKLLYFTLGSTGLPATIQAVIAALRDSDYFVVVSTGDLAAPTDLGPLPENFYVTRYLPGSQVMKQCDLVICHGGNSTVYQALTAGVPVIAIPTHMDQRLNAELLANTGAGAFLKPAESDRIGQTVVEELDKPAFKENAIRLQKILAGYDGPRTAARLIHEHLS